MKRAAKCADASAGLEQFPAAEPLALRVVKLANGKAAHSAIPGPGSRLARRRRFLHSALQGVRATLRINGVVGPPAAEKLELTRTLTAPGSFSSKLDHRLVRDFNLGMRSWSLLAHALGKVSFL